MLVFLNGDFVPEDQATVSVFDRGFLYGDGLFETMRVCGGTPFRWEQHLQRLRRGADFLHLALPFGPMALREQATQLIHRNAITECLLRLSVSRGIGLRGYSPKGADSPTLVMALHPLQVFDAQHPLKFRVMTASLRAPKSDLLGGFKTASKLLQVLARAEADENGMDEALLIDAAGEVVETTASNVFWIEGERVHTPPLVSGALPGVAREVVLELCHDREIASAEIPAAPERLQRASAVFLTNSALGIIEVGELDGVALSGSPVVTQLQSAYQALMESETKRG